MLQQLASFPGLKTGRGYSAVVLDRFQARPAFRRFSIPECWAGAGNEATSAAAQAARLAFSYVLGLLNLCCIWSAVSTACRRSGVMFHSTFLFEARPLFAWVTSRTRLCHIDDRPTKLHFENFNIDYPWP